MGERESRIAIVTGAGTGIGAGIARAFAAEGIRQVLSAAGSFEAAQQLARELSDAGAETHAVQADFREPSSARAVVQAALDRFGRIDILVNNAGFTLNRPFLDSHESDWTSVFNINLHAMAAACHEALPHMVEQESGRIINISSVHGALHMPGHAVYAATKGAVNAFTRALAVEFGPHGVTANVIAPGAIHVERYDREGRDLQALAAQIPAKSLGRAEDIAAAVVYLASDAASYVSGQILYVDGALTARMALD
jgi:NAD(P)-dependent dehydrogenase (short-subunit alcohol dehydrogenase family)